MNVLTVVLKALVALAPLVCRSLPPPDPERAKRREVVRAKKRWWSFRRKLHLAKQRGRQDRRILNIVDDLEKWAEALERLGEDPVAEEAKFQLYLKEAEAARKERRRRKAR